MIPARGTGDLSSTPSHAPKPGLPRKVAERVLHEQITIADQATKVIEHSFLPADQKSEYEALIRRRTHELETA